MKKTIALLALGGALLVPALAEPASAQAHRLSVAKAKRVAKNRVYWHFAPVTRTKVDWWNRWGPREIHLGVTGSWTTSHYESGCKYGYYSGCYSDGYSYKETHSCNATVIVKMSRRGRVRSRLVDEGCLY